MRWRLGLFCGCVLFTGCQLYAAPPDGLPQSVTGQVYWFNTARTGSTTDVVLPWDDTFEQYRTTFGFGLELAIYPTSLNGGSADNALVFIDEDFSANTVDFTAPFVGREFWSGAGSPTPIFTITGGDYGAAWDMGHQVMMATYGFGFGLVCQLIMSILGSFFTGARGAFSSLVD